MQKKPDDIGEINIPNAVEALIFDFDGVFTDNKVIINEKGEESIVCDRSDGLGISEIKKIGIPIIVISTEKNVVVSKRCEKLGIEYYHGVDDKITVLKNWLNQQGIDPINSIYVGNDINDFECLRFVGCGIVVNDAHEDVKKIADYILKKKGGYGAVREVCDIVLRNHC